MVKYNVKYEDMYKILWTFKQDMDYMIKKVDNYKSSLNSYLNTSAMSGKTSDAVNNYFKEVHYVFLETIKQIAQTFLDYVAAYKCCYYSIDTSTKFVLLEEGIGKSIIELSKIRKSFMEETQKVNSALNYIDSIAGVEHYEHPSDQGIPISHENLNTKLTKLDENIRIIESNTVTTLNNSIEPLMALFMKSLESLFVPRQVVPDTYVTGTFAQNQYTTDVMKKNKFFQEEHASKAKALDELWKKEKELHEAVEKEKTQGIWKVIGGLVLIGVGVACIVCTAGAATPIVVGGVVAGSGTALFGSADLIEGGQDIDHSLTGDIDTKSFNYIRDTVFRGNQLAYNITEGLFSFVAGAMIPIGMAYKVGSLTWRSGGVIVGQEALATGAGYGGSYITGKVTDNETFKLLAGLGASIIVGKAGTMADKRFNFSGMHKPDVLNREPVVMSNSVDYFKVKDRIDLNTDAFKAVPEARKECVEKTFSDAPDAIKSVINKLSSDDLKVEEYYYEYPAFINGKWEKLHNENRYDGGDNTIYMQSILDNDQFVKSFRHEYGHYVDTKLVKLSEGSEFAQALDTDISRINKEEMLNDLKSYEAIKDRYVSDILSGSFKNDQSIRDFYKQENADYHGHSDNYWDGKSETGRQGDIKNIREQETFANLFGIYSGSGNDNIILFMEKYYPSTTLTFKQSILKNSIPLDSNSLT